MEKKTEFNTPWRIEYEPQGWGTQTVVFDDMDNCIHHEHRASFDKDRWGHIVHCVNSHPSLVSEIESLKTEVEGLKELLADKQSEIDSWKEEWKERGQMDFNDPQF